MSQQLHRDLFLRILEDLRTMTTDASVSIDQRVRALNAVEAEVQADRAILTLLCVESMAKGGEDADAPSGPV